MAATAKKHEHVLHEGESLADAAVTALKARGEQWTPMLAAVFEAVRGFERPACA